MKYLIAFTLSLIPLSLHAQLVCDTRNKLVTQLESEYDEAQLGYGLTRSGQQMLELFTAPSGGWTVLLTRPDGTSCAMAAGQSWHLKNPEARHKPG